VAKYGYKTVYQPTHPKADVRGYVPEHILIVESMFGHPLLPGQIVHHCDFHRPNNDPKNLKVITRKEHQSLPSFQARFLVEKGLYEEFWEWYLANKDKRDLIREAEVILVQLEEAQKRLERKLK